MDLVIDRNIWLRGEPQLTSYLLRPADQKQCCVGIYLEACGVPRDSLLGIKAAREVEGLPPEASWLQDPRETDEAMALYSVNDANKSGAVDEYTTDLVVIDETADLDELSNLGDVNFVDMAEDLREEFIEVLFNRHGVNVTFIN